MNILNLTYACLNYYKTLDILSSILLAIFFILEFFYCGSKLTLLCLFIHVVIALTLKYYSLRLSIDQNIFQYIQQQSDDNLLKQTKQMDESLMALNLSKSTERSWNVRCLATIHLMKIQFYIFITQILIALITITMFKLC